MTNQLSKEEYISTIKSPMFDISEISLDNPIDIWPYAKVLVGQNILPIETLENTLVAYAYRNNDETFDHILLPTNFENKFIVIIVSLSDKNILGHYQLDLNSEYGIS